MVEPTVHRSAGDTFYTDRVKYLAVAIRGATPAVRAWEFNGWRAESMSWKEARYVHAGLSGSGPLVLRGPDAAQFLESLCINSFAKFPVGSMKHGVMCQADGLIATHGIIERKADDEFQFFAAGMWPRQQLDGTSWKVETTVLDQYLFQIAGPASLQVLERATGESLSDIRFLAFRDSKIDGMRTEVARIGMSGNLAYELHGPSEDGAAIYEAVVCAGEDFGIERLGWGTYLVNHVEGGFPQATWTFVAAAALPAFTAYPSGSVDPADKRARFRSPGEVGWSRMARFDHDFLGRAAVEKEVANPKRTVATLRWNLEDVMDIYASLLRPGEPYRPIDVPYSPYSWPAAHADHIAKLGRHVGISSGTIYSCYFREVLSMACIDLDEAEIGNEVIIHWGDFGGKIKEVRATVSRFPYLTDERNSEIDVSRQP